MANTGPELTLALPGHGDCCYSACASDDDVADDASAFALCGADSNPQLAPLVVARFANPGRMASGCLRGKVGTCHTEVCLESRIAVYCYCCYCCYCCCRDVAVAAVAAGEERSRGQTRMTCTLWLPHRFLPSHQLLPLLLLLPSTSSAFICNTDFAAKVDALFESAHSKRRPPCVRGGLPSSLNPKPLSLMRHCTNY